MTTVNRNVDPILALNSGSSSLKFGLYRNGAEDEELLLKGSAEGIGRESGSIDIRSADGKHLHKQDHLLESQHDALTKVAETLRGKMQVAPVGVGHRVVHGGPHIREHQRITPELIRNLEAAVHFAPLHIPQALALIQQAQQIFPDIPHFACLDNAFHRNMPDVATHLPLPAKYFDQGVQRYGFHGLSCESIVHRLGRDLPRRTVIAHLGNGSSVTAVLDGHSIDTSMGLTPTGGLPMSTRSGDLDPGVLLYLMRTESMSADTLETLLNQHSGLSGFTDGKGDVQRLLQSLECGDAQAALALNAFTTAVRKYIGAYTALMEGIDLVVFTGGIGQHSAVVRQHICNGLQFLGINPRDEDGRIKVMQTEEERQIARHSRQLINRAPLENAASA
jgi:acetate kinase